MRTHTHTHALLELSLPSFSEISRKLKDAGYGHAFSEDEGRTIIDMQGIAVVASKLKGDDIKHAAKTFSILEELSLFVAQKYNLTEREIKRRTNQERIVFPRQVVMFIARSEKIPSQTIGDFFGKGHDTVLHAEKRVRDRMETEPKLKIFIQQIQKEFEQQKGHES